MSFARRIYNKMSIRTQYDKIRGKRDCIASLSMCSASTKFPVYGDSAMYEEIIDYLQSCSEGASTGEITEISSGFQPSMAI